MFYTYMYILKNSQITSLAPPLFIEVLAPSQESEGRYTEDVKRVTRYHYSINE
jgi:hypothetical protein